MCKAHPPRDTDLAETFAMRYVLTLGKFGFFVEKITQFLLYVKLPLVLGKLSRQPVVQQAFLMRLVDFILKQKRTRELLLFKITLS